METLSPKAVITFEAFLNDFLQCKSPIDAVASFIDKCTQYQKQSLNAELWTDEKAVWMATLEILKRRQQCQNLLTNERQFLREVALHADTLTPSEQVSVLLAKSSALHEMVILKNIFEQTSLLKAMPPDAQTIEAICASQKSSALEDVCLTPVMQFLFTCLRKGTLHEGVKFCAANGLEWLAISLTGGDCLFGTDASEVASYERWKEACKQLASHTEDAHEAAIYSLLVGDAKAAHAVCANWRDRLWSDLFCAIRRAVERCVFQNSQHSNEDCVYGVWKRGDSQNSYWAVFFDALFGEDEGDISDIIFKHLSATHDADAREHFARFCFFFALVLAATNGPSFDSFLTQMAVQFTSRSQLLFFAALNALQSLRSSEIFSEFFESLIAQNATISEISNLLLNLSQFSSLQKQAHVLIDLKAGKFRDEICCSFKKSAKRIINFANPFAYLDASDCDLTLKGICYVNAFKWLLLVALEEEEYAFSCSWQSFFAFIVLFFVYNDCWQQLHDFIASLMPNLRNLKINEYIDLLLRFEQTLTDFELTFKQEKCSNIDKNQANSLFDNLSIFAQKLPKHFEENDVPDVVSANFQIKLFCALNYIASSVKEDFSLTEKLFQIADSHFVSKTVDNNEDSPFKYIIKSNLTNLQCYLLQK